LTYKVGGYTNIEDGLKKGLGELNKARALHKVGVIVTDGGLYDGERILLEWQTIFPRLHVVMMEDNDCKYSICQDMATAGKGKVFKIGDFDDLPKVSSPNTEQCRSDWCPSFFGNRAGWTNLMVIQADEEFSLLLLIETV